VPAVRPSEDTSPIVGPMKKRLFIGLIVLALLILAALGSIVRTGGD